MTRDEWLSCRDARPMLDWLTHPDRHASDRKLRLWTVACLRRLWGWLRPVYGTGILDAAEIAADSPNDRDAMGGFDRDGYGLAGNCLLRRMPAAGARHLADFAAVSGPQRFVPVLTDALRDAFGDPFSAPPVPPPVVVGEPLACHGEPPVAERVPPEEAQWICVRGEDEEGWLVVTPVMRWNYGGDYTLRTPRAALLTPDVLTLARAAYRDRLPDCSLDPLTLYALADALEETGAPPALAESLRSEGPHHRGLWSLDCVLGRE